MNAWIVRAGRNGVYAEEWVEAGCVGIGWDFDGANIAAMGRDEIHDTYAAAHPTLSKPKVAAVAGQVYHFAHDVVEGSTVVMYDPATRKYHVGVIAGPCVSVSDTDGLTYSRKVTWGKKTALRDDLQPSSKNSLGGIQTVFTVKQSVLADLEHAMGQKPAAPVATSPEASDGADDVEETTTYSVPNDGIEAIKDRVSALSWEDMEVLTAGLLRAMGYHADVTGPGPDGGRDVVASVDALGLEHPRIVAEVKHRKGAMGAPHIRSFIAGLHGNERGLYVSTGGFSKDAHVEAMHAAVPVRLVDLDAFVRLYIDNYANADEETRGILPLGCIWYPA